MPAAAREPLAGLAEGPAGAGIPAKAVAEEAAKAGQDAARTHARSRGSDRAGGRARQEEQQQLQALQIISSIIFVCNGVFVGCSGVV